MNRYMNIWIDTHRYIDRYMDIWMKRNQDKHMNEKIAMKGSLTAGNIATKEKRSELLPNDPSYLFQFNK